MEGVLVAQIMAPRQEASIARVIEDSAVLKARRALV